MEINLGIEKPVFSCRSWEEASHVHNWLWVRNKGINELTMQLCNQEWKGCELFHLHSFSESMGT